jgi:hypothetical protein
MIIYLPPNEILGNPKFIPIDIRSDRDGLHKLDRVTHYTRVPSQVNDNWDNIFYFRYIGSHDENESSKNSLGGYIYILTNKSFPGKCKIGFTTLTPTQRLKQINGTGVINDWELIYDYKCSRPYDMEQTIHLKLSDLRVRTDREFFDIEVNKAIELINEIGPMFGPL